MDWRTRPGLWFALSDAGYRISWSDGPPGRIYTAWTPDSRNARGWLLYTPDHEAAKAACDEHQATTQAEAAHEV